MRRIYSVFFVLCLCAYTLPAFAQSFSVEAYKQFLEKNKNMTVEEMLEMYPAGKFVESLALDITEAQYLDSIDAHYLLTNDEKRLLEKHGFVVTERLNQPTFVQAYGEIFHKDLPVFISTDGILHAVHMSYSSMLQNMERNVMLPAIQTMLTELHTALPTLAQDYSQPEMRQMLVDLDVYCSVPLALLGAPTTPVFSESKKTVDELLTLIKEEKAAIYPLFATTPRAYDFSQFTPRGHYTSSLELTRYFQAMMWLGRTELYLIPPTSAEFVPTPEDVQRQTITTALLLELMEQTNSFATVEKIDKTLAFLVGEQDNVQAEHIHELFASLGVQRASNLLDKELLITFQETLAKQPYAFQHIMSQILYNNPGNPEQIRPASAFLLIGQRFIIDSYITGNVVFDRIAQPRMLPSTLDILFALGNDATAQLLQPELQQYSYAPNLAALRYLVHSYNDEFWNSTYYTMWLNSIRTLNPPADRTKLPAFMQTAAWWQEKMNTQLASWAQLRHDNLLYAKQSYSGGITCSFPSSYVEPIPAFYTAIQQLAHTTQAQLKELAFQDASMREFIYRYFDGVIDIMQQLEGIARKELDGSQLSEKEEKFLQSMLFQTPGSGCTGPEYNGWYTQLYLDRNSLEEKDLVVADVHTAPTDADGTPVGWVLHGGTGAINMGVWVSSMPNGKQTAFVGPVMSYYENITTNFKRLTDEEWAETYNVAPSARPNFVNIYLANSQGEGYAQGAKLFTGALVSGVETTTGNAVSIEATAFPNPFQSYSTIRFTVPPQVAGLPAQLTIYNAQGQVVQHLLHAPVPANTYLLRWYGTTQDGKEAPNGAYYYKLTIGTSETTGMVVVER